MSKKDVVETVSKEEGAVIEGSKEILIETNKNLELYNHWKAPPEEVLKSFDKGTFKGTDIKPQWRVKVLTEIFGPCGLGWYFDVIGKWIEEYGAEVKVFVEIQLYVKDPGTGEWSKPIYGTGGNHMVNQYGRVSDEGYKMATTDAISYACQQLGIAGDIYMGFEKTKYTGSDADKQPSCEAAKYKGKAPKSKTVKEGPKNKFGMDIGELFGKTREFYVDLINTNYRDAAFRNELKAYVTGKEKTNYNELSDMYLQDFFMTIE